MKRNKRKKKKRNESLDYSLPTGRFDLFTRCFSKIQSREGQSDFPERFSKWKGVKEKSEENEKKQKKKKRRNESLDYSSPTRRFDLFTRCLKKIWENDERDELKSYFAARPQVEGSIRLVAD